jgi:hypothetical protein
MFAWLDEQNIELTEGIEYEYDEEEDEDYVAPTYAELKK